MTPVEDLLAQATTIKNETVENNNSATRVGAWMEEVIPHLEQIANKAESGGSEKTLKAVDDEIVQLAGDVRQIDDRIDEIITTPVPTGEIIAQEIIDARQGNVSLGANITSVKEQINDLAYNVKKYGAKGDGITDDTVNVLSAINDANGHRVFFPEGVYVLDNLALTGDVDLLLDPKATLLAKPNTDKYVMIVFSNANSLKIEGGTIDGNVANRNVVNSDNRRPYVITGHCQEGKTLIIRNVKVKNTISSFVYIQKFGGYIDISNNIFTDQAEGDGILHHDTSILKVISGQDGAMGGLVRFNHNRCIGTATPLLDGGSPGGIFLNNALTTPSQGNMSTLEAIGNYFYGYGLMCGGNDISPLHTYPTWGGVRIIGNYFEQCGFCAISAKSAENFICANNVIVNGQVSTMNIASEGAISYVPGYQAGTNARPHATITGNIIDSPGEQTGVGKQYGIAVYGTGTSFAQDAIIANNVINNAGVGIAVNYAKDITLSNNTIKGAEGGISGTEYGIRLDNIQGDINISGNDIVANNGYGITGQAGLINARLFLSQNKIKHGYGASPVQYGLIVMGAKLLKLNGNTFDSAGAAVAIRKDAANNKVKHLVWDNSNTILAGSVGITWADIEKASGFLQAINSPQNIVTPAEIGVMYRQTNGVDGKVIWVSYGLTSDSWEALTGDAADVIEGTPTITPLTALGTNGTVTITGTDTGGIISATCGDSPTGTAIAKITFSSYRALPKGVILTPAEGNASAKTVIVYDTTIKTTDFSISIPSGVLVAGTNYKWYYKLIS